MTPQFSSKIPAFKSRLKVGEGSYGAIVESQAVEGIKKPAQKNRRVTQRDLKSFGKSGVSQGYAVQDMAVYP